jgi:Dolichyl-phosphate-mannose-protein mannosyltransferase
METQKRWWSRVLAAALVGGVLWYAAALRMEALAQIHGPITSPAWAATLQETLRADGFRPEGMTWGRWEGRYISDPYTYLEYARGDHAFFDAHRREPLFVFTTRAWLWLLEGQDVAVSWNSAMFSWLAVVAIWLLGRELWGNVVGLVTAALFSIESTVLFSSAGGWRDDAYSAVFLLTLHALFLYRRRQNLGAVVWLGVIGGLACLVRITSLSFVVPALVLAIWWSPAQRRLVYPAAAAVLTLLLIGPFMYNCWRVFGDPLYAINVHADVYRATEGQAIEQSQTAREYLINMASGRPWQTLDTAIQGLTSYPFANKWDGFSVWSPFLGRTLAVLAIGGLVAWLMFPTGRWLWLLAIGSLVPYALTWKLISDYRFTMHVYPVLLLASAWCLVPIASIVRPSFSTQRDWLRWPSKAEGLLAGGAVVIAGLTTWASLGWLPHVVAQETLRTDGVVTVPAGMRDRWFFVEGWGPPRQDGAVTTRASVGSRAVLNAPVVAGRPIELALRIDPFPAPLAASPGLEVFVSVDGEQVGRWPLTWNPDRIGYYSTRVPPRAGSTMTVVLEVMQPSGTPGRMRVWWMRVRPQ